MQKIGVLTSGSDAPGMNACIRAVVRSAVQRGGAPTARDRVLASRLGMAAIEGILNGKEGHVVGEKKGEVVYIPFHELWKKKKELDTDLLESSKMLAM